MHGSIFLLAVAAAAAGPSEGFHFDLSHTHPELRVTGAEESDGAVRYDGRGMRIVFAGQPGDPSRVAVAPVFEVTGDFQITLDYEILDGEEPEKGFGAGVKIWGELDDARGPQALTIARLMRPHGHEVVAIWNDTSLPNKEGMELTSQAYDSRQGRLRLKRAGANVQFLAAGPGEQTFAEVFAADVSTAPLKNLRFIATGHGQPCRMDVRLIAIEIGAQAAPIAAPREKGISPWVWAWVLVIGAVTAGGCGAALFWRWRRRDE